MITCEVLRSSDGGVIACREPETGFRSNSFLGFGGMIGPGPGPGRGLGVFLPWLFGCLVGWLVVRLAVVWAVVVRDDLCRGVDEEEQEPCGQPQPTENEQQPEPAAEEHDRRRPTLALRFVVVVVLLFLRGGRSRAAGQRAGLDEEVVVRLPGFRRRGRLRELDRHFSVALWARDRERVASLGHGKRGPTFWASGVLRHGNTLRGGDIVPNPGQKCKRGRARLLLPRSRERRHPPAACGFVGSA